MPYTSSLPRLLKCYTVRNWEFILFRVISWWMLMWLLLALCSVFSHSQWHINDSLFLSTTTNTPLGYAGKSVFSWRWCAASVVEVRRPRRRGRLNETTTTVRCDPRNTFRSWLFMNLQIPGQQHTRGCASGRFPSFRQSDCQSVSERVSQSGSQLVLCNCW